MKNTSYWQPSWIFKMGKMKNYPFMFKSILSRPDFVLQQLINIIYAN